MKLALLFFLVLTGLSLWFAPQGTAPVVCRGKPLSITLLEKPGLEWRVPPIPIRFGGSRYGLIWQIAAENPFRRVIKTREEFIDWWKGFTKPSGWQPPLPEVDFSREMVVMVGLGFRPNGGYAIMIDGACEVNGQVELFVTIVDDGKCPSPIGVVAAPADIVRITRSDLPIVYREIHVPCSQLEDHLKRLPGGNE